MKYNLLTQYISEDPHYYFESVVCPYCEETQIDVYTLKPQCTDCGYHFMITENGDVDIFLDPLKELGIKGCESKFISEEISKVAQGRPGWKSIVATYHDPLKSDTFDIFWSMTGANALFKNGDKVDLAAASQASMTADKTNQTKYHYDPNIERIESTTEIKSIINKYNLDQAGYSVSSFLISPDGNKIFSGAPIESFDSRDAAPFFSALEQCRALKASMAGQYSPSPNADQEKLQIAINNFIADDPMILSLPTGNMTPDQVGKLSDFTASQQENVSSMELESYDEDFDLLIEAWGAKFTPTQDNKELVGGRDWDNVFKDQSVVDFNIPMFQYTISNENIKVYGSNHSAYRIQNQRAADESILSINSNLRLDTDDIDLFVGSFVDYMQNDFNKKYEINNTVTFLYILTDYNFGFIFSVTEEEPVDQISLDTVLPYSKRLGDFHYIVKDDKLVGGKLFQKPNVNHVNKQKARYKADLKKQRDSVDIDVSSLNIPKGLKGAKKSKWIKDELLRRAKANK